MAVVLFGDETGISLALTALAGNMDICAVVYDPERAGMREWAAAATFSGEVLPHPNRTGRKRFVQQLAALQPVLGLVVSYSRILWSELIDIFPNGVVNLHGGRLPEYRGANVLQWALIEGETLTGVTMHYVEERVDTGPVIAMAPVIIADCDTALTLREKMGLATIALLREWGSRLVAGKVGAVPQDESQARVWPRRTPSDGQIDWSWSNPRIRNHTRALVAPWPGVFYRDGAGRKVVVDHVLSVEEIQRLRLRVSHTCGETPVMVNGKAGAF